MFDGIIGITTEVFSTSYCGNEQLLLIIITDENHFSDMAMKRTIDFHLNDQRKKANLYRAIKNDVNNPLVIVIRILEYYNIIFNLPVVCTKYNISI